MTKDLLKKWANKLLENIMVQHRVQLGVWTLPELFHAIQFWKLTGFLPADGAA